MSREMATGVILILAFLAGWAGNTGGSVQQHAGHSLGSVDFPVSCSAPAQIEFNRAAALLHHMTYPQAREAFLEVATIDPGCAMAEWGV
ncbi:MAG TPA: hypothetical protein VJN01_14055, partial [Xanthomonadales bacterium]|nr:hypothetical protein [Xanthomonadales bacterium]